MGEGAGGSADEAVQGPRPLVRAAFRAAKRIRASLRQARRRGGQALKRVGQARREARLRRQRTRRLEDQQARKRAAEAAVRREVRQRRLDLARRRVANVLGLLDFRFRAADERVDCPACHARTVKHLSVVWQPGSKDEPRTGFISGCRRCGLVFLNPQPSAEVLTEFYAPESNYVRTRWNRKAGRRTQSGPQAPPGSEGTNKFRKIGPLFRTIAARVDVFAPPAGAKALDYGCGPGRTLDRLKALGWETYGIEPGVKSAFAHHIELLEPPRTPMFHLIVLHHVLEHLTDPLDLLRALAASLRDDGVLFLSVPRLDAVHVHGRLRYCINAPKHIVAFTRDCLMTLLAMAGLRGIDTDNTVELDGVFTQGEPLRLRLFAVRDPQGAHGAVRPLRSAEAALAAYAATFRPRRSLARRLVPLRIQANWMQRRRRGGALRRQARKLRAAS
jgi:SAM-dependent methyltransferase